MENNFAKGIYAKRHEKAPDFVVCQLSIKKNEFIDYLKSLPEAEYLNFKVNRSKKDPSKMFVAVDDWKPTKQEDQKPPIPTIYEQQSGATIPEAADDDLPF